MATYTGSDKRLQYLFQNGGGGGTTVVANPSGTPTDWLNSLQVGNDIYSVAKVGDCYSTTERQIGCYTDGKPLYQKTIDMGTLSAGTYKTVLYSNVGISDIEHVAYIDIIINDVYNVNFNRPDNVNAEFYSQLVPTGIFLRAFNTAVTRAIATIRYTKTTDTAGSGIWTPSGSYAKHYHATEQVIGTWVDGKTLYEITFEIPNSITGSWSAYTHNISNIDTIIEFSGVYKRTSDGVSFPLNCYNTASTQSTTAVNRTQISYFYGTGFGAGTIIITIRYTKTE